MEEGSRSPSAVRSGFLHELSIAESVVRIASRQADGRRVMKMPLVRGGEPARRLPSAVWGVRKLRPGDPRGRRAYGRVTRVGGGIRMHRTAVKKVVLENVLDANDTLARANRDMFDRAETYTINMMSSPGAGKTALLERTLERLRSQLRLGVLEGDVQTTLDADRLARFHIPLVQVNTDPGFGGECHLDANMVRSGLGELPLEDMDILIIENVGNLVCPAEFRVGEDSRVMVYSVTEGEEKPLKYPLMFRSADLVLVNKVDLLEHLDFDLEQFLGNLDAVNPGVRTVLTSARTGQGVDEWCDWLGQRLENV